MRKNFENKLREEIRAQVLAELKGDEKRSILADLSQRKKLILTLTSLAFLAATFAFGWMWGDAQHRDKSHDPKMPSPTEILAKMSNMSENFAFSQSGNVTAATDLLSALSENATMNSDNLFANLTDPKLPAGIELEETTNNSGEKSVVAKLTHPHRDNQHESIFSGGQICLLPTAPYSLLPYQMTIPTCGTP